MPALPPTVITERDVELLRALLTYRYLSIPQLQRLFFPSLQTANRRVRVLAGAGHLTTFRLPGIADRLLALSPQGAELAAGDRPPGPDALDGTWARRKPKDYYFARHLLAITDFRIALDQAAAATPELKVLGFLTDSIGQKRPGGGLNKYIRDAASDSQHPQVSVAHVPDGVFALERAGKAALFFLEVDRGTEELSNPERGFLKAVRFYLNYLVSRGYQRYRADFGVTADFEAFRVLIVTSSAKRLANMRDAGARLPFEPASAKKFLWLTTSEQVIPATLFTPIWWSLPPDETRPRGIVTT